MRTVTNFKISRFGDLIAADGYNAVLTNVRTQRMLEAATRRGDTDVQVVDAATGTRWIAEWRTADEHRAEGLFLMCVSTFGLVANSQNDDHVRELRCDLQMLRDILGGGTSNPMMEHSLRETIETALAHNQEVLVIDPTGARARVHMSTDGTYTIEDLAALVN